MAFVIGGDKHLHTSIHGFMATNAEIKLLSKQDAENSDYRLCGECARRADIVDTYESIEQHTDSQYQKKPAVQTLFDSSGKEDLEEEPAYVWICTGTSSHAYHYYMDCIGLSSCKAEIDEISLEEAEKRGRTPCHLCREREATELDY